VSVETPVTPDAPTPRHLVSYPRFLLRALRLATDGDGRYLAWMTLLTAVALVGLHAWCVQVRDGMAVTNLTDQVSWGLYIANFTFLVGLAAGGVMMVIPTYVYRDEPMHAVVYIGELLAISALLMCLLFVVVDIGRPDHAWHMIPGVGRFNWPLSMLTWDVVVLNGYLLINLHLCGYQLYQRFLGRSPEGRGFLRLVFLSMGWAISIHTVTAFLYCGLGGRPFWNSALLAPRFLASAFVSGPCFILCALAVIERVGGLRVGPGPRTTLLQIARVAIVVDLLMLGSEMFTELYTGGAHTSSARYLYFGLPGHHALVPWFWASVALIVGATVLLLRPSALERPRQLYLACALAFAGVWIEKGMGLIVPAFIPSPLHEVVEYSPSLVELQVMAGIWAFGLLVFTASLKVAVPIFRGDARLAEGN
jgi:Ni/Fe-hydrogenase subunit HybB-like protein